MNVITNRHNLPQEVYDALTKNRYSADDGSGASTDYSISAVIAPTQQTILRRRYPGCNSEDAIDRVWTLFGHIAHALLEEHGSDGSIVEKRFYVTILGKTISGQVDHYKNRKITDYKTTSAYKVAAKEFSDWEAQLNSYAFICEENELPVDSIRIVAIIRDWNESEAERDYNYPQAPILVIGLVKWSRNVRERYLSARVQALCAAEQLSDDRLPKCTDKERWQRTTGFAVMKAGAKRATRVFEHQSDAVKFVQEKFGDSDEYSVQVRKTEPRRCMKYCNVSSVCHQHQAYLKEMEAANGEE